MGHARRGMEKFYRRLKAYRAEHGDCLVPHSYVTPEGTKLGRWVATQRKYHNDDRGRLSEERTTRLEVLGFVWVG